MSKQVRVNIRCNSIGKPREEVRNGRKVVIVSSATMPDNVVMNDIRYPAEVIANSFASLDRTPAPLGHPYVNGRFVSARDPEGINMNWVGAWNENVRRENGRVFLDKVIDVEVANRTETGRGLLSAINEGKPIHTSTGLIANLDEAPENSGAKYVATNILFDHDAILLNEKGAATPEQGVGMFVNAAGEKIDVVNSVLEDDAERELDWAADMAARAVDKLARVPTIERIKTAIMSALMGGDGGKFKPQDGESDMPVDEKQFNELSAQVKNLTESVGKIGETIANAVNTAVKPLTDNLAAIQANQDAKDKAELQTLVNKIVKANLMDETSAKELTLNAARVLAEKATPGTAAALGGTFAANKDGDEFASVDLNAAIDGGKK